MADELEFAKEVAVEAGKILRKFFEEGCTSFYKEGKELVTEADLVSEKLILERLKQRFPKYNVWSEEFGAIDNNSESTWIVDPLDGTTNFSAKIPLFSVSIALWKQNKPYIGVVYNPITNQLSWAEKGKGAFTNNKQLRVCDKKIEDSVALVDSKLLQSEEKTKKFRSLLEKVYRARAIGVATTNFLTVASGGSTICIDLIKKPGDFAASAIILEEAGGKMTTLEGKELSLKTENVLATNGFLHERVLELIKNDKYSTHRKN